jgi:predicted unusual protein kinase regulating ubiquinone biosynthesis (AarF/ABC1/UbiB family)
MKPARVSQTRFGRLAGMALAVGELALGGVVEGVRRIASGQGEATSAFLSADNARRLAARLARLRGGAMKLGQMMSLQGTDLLPPEFAQALAILRAQAAPMPQAQLRGVLGREYGKGWQARFEDFDHEPIAAASIGQVHRVRTTDGRQLALKIQYPGVARSIKSDVDNFATLLHLLKLLPHEVDVSAIAAEAARQLGQEADYLAEAAFLERYARLVADEPRLVVPRVHRDLTTARILAMDYMQGESGKVVLLDFGATLRFSAAFVRHYARITRAVIDGNRAAVAREAIAIGYAAENDAPALLDATTDMILLVCEPLRQAGRYDFAASDLPARARALGFDLAIRQGLLRTPPAQTLFLHRKLVGSFLTLAHIHARVDARALALPLLKRALTDAGP